MSTTINVGIIGLGRIADVHYPGYKRLKDVKLYAVCDTNRETAERRKKEWKAEKVYTDYLALLADKEIDAVEILSPQKLHEEMAIAALKAGKHVALQKPMTISLESAKRISDAAASSGKIFRVTDNYIFYPPIQLVKEFIEDGSLGEIQNMRIKFISGGSGGWEVPSGSWEWRLKEKEEGRGMQTFDHGHHLWATAWYLLGEVERVNAWIDSIDGIIDSPAVVQWKYKNGKKYGICDYSHSDGIHIPSKYYANDEWFEVTGSHGIAVIHRCTGDLIEGAPVSVYDGKKWKEYKVPSDWVEGFANATENFIQSIKGAEKPMLSASDAYEVLKFSLSIQKSARERREVYLDEWDSLFPKWHSKNRIDKDIKSQNYKASFLERIGLLGNDSGYADKAEELTKGLLNRFDGTKAGDWETSIGLVLSPQGKLNTEKKFLLKVKAGKAEILEGSFLEQPVLTVRVPAGTWGAILSGKKRIETAFITGKLKVEGKAEEGLRLRAVFGI